MSSKSCEQRARRAARRKGLCARKSRRRFDNCGGFQIIDPTRTWIVAGGILTGEKFDLQAEEVIDFCNRK